MFFLGRVVKISNNTLQSCNKMGDKIYGRPADVSNINKINRCSAIKKNNSKVARQSQILSLKNALFLGGVELKDKMELAYSFWDQKIISALEDDILYIANNERGNFSSLYRRVEAKLFERKYIGVIDDLMKETLIGRKRLQSFFMAVILNSHRNTEALTNCLRSLFLFHCIHRDFLEKQVEGMCKHNLA